MPLLQYEWSLWIQALSQGPAIPAFFSQSLRECRNFLNCICWFLACAGPSGFFSSCGDWGLLSVGVGASVTRLLLSRSARAQGHTDSVVPPWPWGPPVSGTDPRAPCAGRWIPSHRATREARSVSFVQPPSCAASETPALACSFAKRAICAPLLSGRLRVLGGSEECGSACHGHRLRSQSPAEEVLGQALSAPG